MRQQLKVHLNSKALRGIMARRNLSQERLARQLRISPTYLSQMMLGRRNPSPMTRQRLLDALEHYKFEDLFFVDVDGSASSPGETSEALANG